MQPIKIIGSPLPTQYHNATRNSAVEVESLISGTENRVLKLVALRCYYLVLFTKLLAFWVFQ